MNTHVEELLPFYINDTLTARQRAIVEMHLKTCGACKVELAEWRLVQGGIQHLKVLHKHAAHLPALSPIVRGSLVRTPGLKDALLSAANLVWAQRIFPGLNRLIPILSGVIAFAVLLSVSFGEPANARMAIPLFALMPLLAILAVAFLYNLEHDPALEVITATPTASITLIYSRLTLALGAVCLFGAIGSLLVTALGWGSFVGLVATWLGPLLLLSAATTLASLLWSPPVGAGLSIAAWSAITILLSAEMSGTPILRFSFEPLLHPTWAIFLVEAISAVTLWLLSWWWFSKGTQPYQQLERG